MPENTLRLLAIDDNTDNLITIRALITEAFPSAKLFTSTSGVQGIELAISEDPHVILLDVVMPGMDGLAVCRQLKSDERSRHIPIIILTALKSDRQIRLEALEAGAEVFLAKPIDAVELIAQVKAMIKIKDAVIAQRIENEQLTSLVNERTLAIEKELAERRQTEKELQEANLKLKQTQAATLNLLEDLKLEMSAREKSEQALKNSEEKHRYISTTISDMAFSCKLDDKGNYFIDWLTGAAEKLTGYTIEEIFEKKCWRFLVLEEDIPLFETKVTGVMRGSSGRAELRIRKKDGSVSWIESYVECVAEDSADYNFMLYGGIVDISERKRYESEILSARDKAEESDRLKSAFLANMSHEIRTPMNGIIGFSSLLNEPDLDDTERNRFVKIINDNCQQLLHIISDIIDISKIEAGLIDIETVDFNLNDMMDSLLENYLPKASRKGLSMSLHKDLLCDECIVGGDPSKTRQVLENLLTNALKFTSQGEINFGYRLVNDQLELFVEDTGIGISPEHQVAVFDRFWQVEAGLARQYGGTGLGLSISKAFIRKLGGDIYLESMPGKGSRFLVILPYHPKSQKISILTDKPDRPGQIIGKTILVVEDEADNFEFLQVILHKLKLRVLHAWNGAEALHIFKEHPEIDLILMDFKLPDIPGQEVTRTILKLRKDMPVIATTAYAMSGDREKAILAGCIDYIAKPIRMEEIVGMLHQYLLGGRRSEVSNDK